MTQPIFADILEAAEQLPLQEREDLVRILANRIREQKRAILVKDVEEAQEEFALNKSQPVTPEQLMEEILS
jgi:hypothetical protein